MKHLAAALILPLLLTTTTLAQQNRRPAEADAFANPPPFNAARTAIPELAEIHILKGWIDLVESYTKLAKDPVAAGVAAVVSANDMLKHKGNDAAIEYFSKLMPEVKNESVQRAIRLQLVELYGKAGQPDQALEQLKVLMIQAPKESAGAPKHP
jgi:hypothetical protein